MLAGTRPTNEAESRLVTSPAQTAPPSSASDAEDSSPRLRRVIPILHPAFLVRGGWAWRGKTAEDLRKATEPRRESRSVNYSRDWQPRAWPIPDSVPLAIDLETVKGTHKITQVNWAVQEAAAYAGAWTRETAMEVERALLQDRTLVLHNAQFDLDQFRANGILARGELFDTMIAHAILDPDLPNNLETVAKDYTDIQPWKHLSRQDLQTYGCIDADATFRLYVALVDELKAQGVWRVCKTSMEVLPVILDMWWKGLRVDEKEMRKRAGECEVREGEARLELNALAQGLPRRQKEAEEIRKKIEGLDSQTMEGGTGARKLKAEIKRLQKELGKVWEPNWNSPKQLVTVLDDLGLPRKINKKTGQVTTDAAVIQEFARQTGNPVLKRLLDFREAGKLRTTYYEKPLSEDSRIHPQYLLHRDYDVEGGEEGACSGRLASKGPNIQNWPEACRGIIVPDEEGGEIAEADYKQIEFAIMAWRAGGRLWKLMNTEGFDVHRETAAKIYGVTLDGVTKPQRDIGKRSNYAGIYGVGPLTFSRRLAAEGIFIAVNECKRFLTAFRESYPEVGMVQKEFLSEAFKTNKVTNPFGRFRRFYKPSQENTEIYNIYPQGTAGDIVLRAMSILGRELQALTPARLAIQVHDSLTLIYPQELRCRVLELLYDVMPVRADNKEMPGFLCPIDVKVGTKWGMNDVAVT